MLEVFSDLDHLCLVVLSDTRTMMELVILIAQTATLTAITAWLLIGVYGNVRYPEHNETATSRIMAMTRMEQDYPEEFARVAHRALRNSKLQHRVFYLVVTIELIAVTLLLLGIGAMVLAIMGVLSPDTARALALLGATAFTSIWSGFLVIGNYFCYWFDIESGQNTHFQMTLWGLASMILLIVA
ncbi:MAG: DUF2165 family protein [Rhodobacteraceae bacterium]|nr:DUF2165 family protein [Paracoccaceae bacterium]